MLVRQKWLLSLVLLLVVLPTPVFALPFADAAGEAAGGAWDFMTKQRDVSKIPLIGNALSGALSWAGSSDIGNAILKYGLGINVDRETGKVTTSVVDTVLNVATIVGIGALTKGGAIAARLGVRGGIGAAGRGVNLARLAQGAKNANMLSRTIGYAPKIQKVSRLAKFGKYVKSFSPVKYVKGPGIRALTFQSAKKSRIINSFSKLATKPGFRTIGKWAGNLITRTKGRIFSIERHTIKAGTKLGIGRLRTTAIRTHIHTMATGGRHILARSVAKATATFGVVGRAFTSIKRSVSSWFKPKKSTVKRYYSKRSYSRSYSKRSYSKRSYVKRSSSKRSYSRRSSGRRR